MVAAVTRARLIVLEQEIFNSYIGEEGLEPIVAARAARGQTYADGRERYSKIAKLALAATIDAYNFPEGAILHLYRAIAAGKPGTLSKVGLGTYIDPRVDGGKLNGVTREDLVEILRLGDEDWLFFKAFPINVVFIRGTTSDTDGNITMEREALILEDLALAMAAKGSGGHVICQVERIAERGSLPAKQVKIPGILVDCVVVATPELHMQNYATSYNPAFSGEIR
ncbi:MAG: hypothetical protein IH789_02925, partial [Acidobacteria bacterium]|nr:hypothetical protein [Acidobacteriota bacterium]